MSKCIVFSVIVFNIIFCECSNIFHVNSKIVYLPDDGSEYFGYTVLLSEKRLIVGAPKARSRLKPTITSGQVFKCPYGDLNLKKNVSCIPIGVAEEIEDKLLARFFSKDDLVRDDMWFGATISAMPNGALFVCAPRWNKPYKDTHLLQNGLCYMLSFRSGKEYLPLDDRSRQAFLSDDRRPEYGEFGTNLNYYAYGQAGFSMKISESSIIIGAPGLLQWTGGFVEYRLIDKSYRDSYISKRSTINTYFTMDVDPNNYLGYSVESGIFIKNGTSLFVAGAPRSKYGYGQVLIFQSSLRETYPLDIKHKIIGPQFGAYFGATLRCADINGDGIADLLVGAPNFVKKDVILHYDQGAVFVYITRTKDTNFTLEAAGYVMGSKGSGARFGSSIANLGDIDGDGFNDIAIGAPWEDDGKGAVYIYGGGENGLKLQYNQKITVAGSKAFGFSISKGLDVDNNNCGDLAVGAHSMGAAYLFRCVPTVYVNVTIRVPDAVNLPLNATNFTAIFCIKATPRIKMDIMGLFQSNFTARIAIDTKESRASIKGDTEYDISITPGNERCEEQIIVVKPTADLSKPISIKFNLEETDSLEDSQTFPSHGVRLSDDSILETSFKIQLRRDCGQDLVCKPWLQMSLEPFNRSYVPGTEDRLGFRVSVFNKEEPSYGAKVHLTLPSTPKRLPTECSLKKLSVTCDLPAPLSRFETVEWEIELDYTYRDSVDKELNIVATLEDPFYDGTDIERKRKEVVIFIKPEANFTISGKSLPNATISVTRDKLNEADNVTLVHYYEITNYGPSDWFRLPIQMYIPDKLNLSNGIKGCLQLDKKLECAWNLPAKVSLPIVLPLRFDLGSHGLLLEEKNEVNVTSSITILLKGQNRTASIKSTLTLEPAPPIWPYILGGLSGLLLLSILILIFYKYGFFSRTRPGNFKKLQEQDMTDEENNSVENLEASTSGINLEGNGEGEPAFLNETSSQELLTTRRDDLIYSLNN